MRHPICIIFCGNHLLITLGNNVPFTHYFWTDLESFCSSFICRFFLAELLISSLQLKAVSGSFSNITWCEISTDFSTSKSADKEAKKLFALIKLKVLLHLNRWKIFTVFHFLLELTQAQNIQCTTYVPNSHFHRRSSSFLCINKLETPSWILQHWYHSPECIFWRKTDLKSFYILRLSGFGFTLACLFGKLFKGEHLCKVCYNPCKSFNSVYIRSGCIVMH